jgi:hypothetical protein
VTRREIVERVALGVLAVLCLVLAVGLGLLALDVQRSRAAVTGGDVDYRISPETKGL